MVVAVYPAVARNQVQSWIEDNLSDLSVSRPRSRLHWGIPVPDDDSHTVSLCVSVFACLIGFVCFFQVSVLLFSVMYMHTYPTVLT